MDPKTQFCPNQECPLRGQVGQGNIGIHSRKERRYRCAQCGTTFAQSQGTAFYRLRTGREDVCQVLTLLAHGCPMQAIVVAFGIDERTVASWQERAGAHCRQLHEHLVQAGGVDLGHVQADELHVKMAAGWRGWLGLAIAVKSRMWLGAQLGQTRDKPFLRALVKQVRACAKCLGVLICVDGLAGYPQAFRHGFTKPVHTGKVGRPKLVLEKGFLVAQVVKQYSQRRIVSVDRRVAIGTEEEVAAVIQATGTGTGINTAFIERFNALIRARVHRLVRRGRALAKQSSTLMASIYLMGCHYNFCTLHESLRLNAPSEADQKWQERTPAMAAGLTDHRWTMEQLLTYRVPPPACVPPKRRGRKPRPAIQASPCLT